MKLDAATIAELRRVTEAAKHTGPKWTHDESVRIREDAAVREFNKITPTAMPQLLRIAEAAEEYLDAERDYGISLRDCEDDDPLVADCRGRFHDAVAGLREALDGD